MKTKNYIYIYSTEESRKKGLIKIGDAENVEKRIKEQFNTASALNPENLKTKQEYEIEAITKSGKEFRDHQIHQILKNKGYRKHQIIDEDNTVIKANTEWFEISLEKAKHLIESYIDEIPEEQINLDRYNDFPMRPEQEDAVNITQEYFEKNKGNNPEFLWNAKMRFGKTFSAYQLVKKMNFSKILVITYKPGVRNSWEDDLNNHVDFKDFTFLHNDNLNKINKYIRNEKKIVVFASYQDLLGKNSDGSDIKEKHEALFDMKWDILIVDEFHYGTSTDKAKELLKNELESIELKPKEIKEELKELFSEEDEFTKEDETQYYAEEAAKNINTRYKLFLSGTPFKALADNRFSKEAIFNWTYTDEQKAKEEWKPSEKYPTNPYEMLPRIKLYVYKVSDDLVKAGLKENKNEFSLNYFFKVEKGDTFRDENAVKKWLDLISGIIKPVDDIEDQISNKKTKIYKSQYPYDKDAELIDEIDHTLWYFNRTNSAIAMSKLLKEHPIFKQYHIELVTGKGTASGSEALPPVIEAIRRTEKNEKIKGTITITVGKLTTGVSVPEWKGILFLRDTDSPENYFQTAFRAQTPYKDKNGKIKKDCYIFDFSPNRSLKLLTQYSEKLTTDSHLTTSEERIQEFINYLPVLKVFGNGMEELDAKKVLTFDLDGVDAKGLGLKFTEKKNIIVTSEVIALIHENENDRSRCEDIFNKIKMFKKYNIGASKKEMNDSDVDLISLNVNNNKIKKLSSPKKEDKEKKDPEQVKKDNLEKSQKDKVKKLLMTLLSRIPLFMYLTDATEENMEQVLVDTEDDLFRKTTGIEIQDFNFLVEMGLMKIESLDAYVLKFKELENNNYDITNSLVEK